MIYAAVLILVALFQPRGLAALITRGAERVKGLFAKSMGASKSGLNPTA
jgi:hypothetical protein